MRRTIVARVLVVSVVGALAACAAQPASGEMDVGRAISAQEVFCEATPPLVADETATMEDADLQVLGKFPYSIPPTEVNSCGKCWIRRPTSKSDKGEIGDATFCAADEARCCPAGWIATCTTDKNARQCTPVPPPKAGDTCYSALGVLLTVGTGCAVAWGGVQVFGESNAAGALQIARIACRATGNVLACQSEASTGCGTIFKGLPTAIKACVEVTNTACLACTSAAAPIL